MDNTRDHSNISQTEVFSIELNSNPNGDRNDIPLGVDGTPTGRDRSTSQSIPEAWMEENLNSTDGRVHDIWLKGENAVTATEHAINQLVARVKDSLWFQHFYGPIIIALAIASTTICTLWPQHNAILKPEYWYEILGPSAVIGCCVGAPFTIIYIYTVMEVDVLCTWNAYWKLVLGSFFGFTIPYVFLHIIWVNVMDLRHPMPFSAALCHYIAHVPFAIALWFCFPEELRMNNNPLRKQILGLMMLFPITVIVQLGYANLSALFNVIPIEFQWCIALFLPMVKEANTWIYTKVACKAAGGNTLPAKLAGVCGGGAGHMMVLIVLLDSKFEPLTEYLIMICDCIPNVASGMKIIKLHKQGRNMEEQKNTEVKCLVLEEFLEVAVQIAYSTSFILAYYGPNATLLGGVYTDLWQHEKVHSLGDKLSNVGTFFLIDVVQLIICGYTMYRFCELNMYETYMWLSYRYGPLICLTLSVCIYLVRQYFYIISRGKFKKKQ